MKVVIAPDSFKGGPDATRVAQLVGEGWRHVAPTDRTVAVPLADGGEGTLAAMTAQLPGVRVLRIDGVTGPDGRPCKPALALLPDATAVIELANVSGLPQMARPDPLGASTFGLGLVMAAAMDAGATQLVIGLGGSATTDAGSGALSALGLAMHDHEGNRLPLGGGALRRLAHLDASELRLPPPGGVRLLADVTNPLLGERGAARVFGPQKGANQADIRELEAGLGRFAELVGVAPQFPGAGAAGGTAYGLHAMWGAELVGGSAEVAEAAGLRRHLLDADLVLTGEGCFDGTSTGGKVVGHVLELAAQLGVAASLVVGDRRGPVPQQVRSVVALRDATNSVQESMRRVEELLVDAGEQLARTIRSEMHVGVGRSTRKEKHG